MLNPMKLRLRKWVLWWALGGLLVPVLLILRWKLLGSIFGELELILWPSSIMLLGLEGPASRPRLDIVEFYALVMAMNVVLYAVVGLATWPLIRLAFPQRGSVS